MEKSGNNQQMNITFTKEQFKILLKLVYLGNWMANAYRDGSPEDPHISDYEDIENYIFSYAPQFGLAEYMSHEAGNGVNFYPTNAFEEETDVHNLHDEYDEEAFWDELCDRLGERDFHRKYSTKEIESMSGDERFLKLQECIIAYEEEAEDRGIERLEIMKTLNDFGI